VGSSPREFTILRRGGACLGSGVFSCFQTGSSRARRDELRPRHDGPCPGVATHTGMARRQAIWCVGPQAPARPESARRALFSSPVVRDHCRGVSDQAGKRLPRQVLGLGINWLDLTRAIWPGTEVVSKPRCVAAGPSSCSRPAPRARRRQMRRHAVPDFHCDTRSGAQHHARDGTMTGRAGRGAWPTGQPP